MKILHSFETKDSVLLRTDEGLQVIKEFPFLAYEYGKKFNFTNKDIYGKQVVKKVLQNFVDAKSYFWQNKEKVGGMDSLYLQVVNSMQCEKATLQDYNICFFDIETSFDVTKPFVKHDYSGQVLSVALICNGVNTVLYNSSYYKGNAVDTVYIEGKFNYYNNTGLDIKVIAVDSEVELLLEFAKYLKDNKVNILSGWNSEEFDVPYIVNRFYYNELDANLLSPFYDNVDCNYNQLVVKHKDTYNIAGVACLDAMQLFMKYSYVHTESYSLNSIAAMYVNVQKVDHSQYKNLMEFHKENLPEYLFYNFYDTLLVKLITDKLQFYSVAIATVQAVGLDLLYYASQIRYWDALIYKYCLGKNIAIPPNKSVAKDELVGAYVKPVIPGKYKNIVSFDFASLYPSILIAFNLSPETYVGKGKLSGCSHACNGESFSNAAEGIIPILTNRIFNERQVVKKKYLAAEDLKEANKDNPELYEKYKLESFNYFCEQVIRKQSIASVYGVCSNVYFRYYQYELAAAITSGGQELIKHVIAGVNTFLNNEFETTGKDYVPAGDTDSAYITVPLNLDGKTFKEINDVLDLYCEDKLQPEITRLVNNFTAEHNCYKHNVLKMKREAIADSAVWRGAKNYAVRVINDEGVFFPDGKTKITGLESKKGSFPNFARSKFIELYTMVLDSCSEATAVNFVRNIEKEMLKMDFDKVAKIMRLNYNTKSPNMLNNGARLYNKIIAENDIAVDELQGGIKTKYGYLKKRNVYKAESIAFPPTVENAKLFSIIDAVIDKQRLVTDSWTHPATTFLTAAGFDMLYDEKNSLSSFF